MSSALQTFTARSQGEPQTEPMMSDTLSVREYETLLPLRQSSELGMRGTARLSAVLWDPVCPQQRCLGAHPPLPPVGKRRVRNFYIVIVLS